MSKQSPGTPFVLLDHHRSTDQWAILFRDPVRIIEATEPEGIGAAIDALTEALRSGWYAAGFVSYEAGYALEPRLQPLMPKARSVPLIWFAITKEPERLSREEFDGWLAAETGGEACQLDLLDVSLDKAQYLDRFRRVEELIHAGDLYQMNLTLKQRFRLAGPPLALYRKLRMQQRTEYGAFIRTASMSVLSASPELFIRIDDGVIETRPMKGTARRAQSAEADQAAREALAKDTKNRAENLMIVDLMRNDLGRIAEVGSVEVPALFEVETYETLHQMISVVRAKLKDGTGLRELLPALFPAGSITGAPKIRAMEMISAIEREARGIYTGAIGYFAPDGRVRLSVAIRTAMVSPDGAGEMGIGSGVVADSRGPDEYAECLLKMKFLREAADDFQLIETLRFDRTDGRYWLLEEHLARIERSANALGFVFNRTKIEEQLDAATRMRCEAHLRVRLLLSRDGHVAVTAVGMDVPAPDAILRFVFSEQRVRSSDLLLGHKTTRRDLYDGEFERLSNLLGVDEVLFLNEHGELTEGSRTTIFVKRGGGLVTPALSSGLLPGTLRARLIAEGKAVEARLLPEDLDNAEGIFLGNSVRGLVRAEAAS